MPSSCSGPGGGILVRVVVGIHGAAATVEGVELGKERILARIMRETPTERPLLPASTDCEFCVPPMFAERVRLREVVVALNRRARERTKHEPQRDRQLHLGGGRTSSATPASAASTRTSSCPSPCCAGSTACWSPRKRKVLAVEARFKGKLDNLDPQLRRASGFAF